MPSTSPPSDCSSRASTEPDSETSDSEDDEQELMLMPENPYEVGSIFVARRHTPPAPFGGNYATEWPPVQDNWEILSQTEYCLSRPPVAGITHLNETRELKITSMIRTGYQCGAQLVIVNDNMVAKIFDPLYHEGSSRWGIKKDVVVKADGDYGREAAAYAELQKSPVALRHTAQYYGSWTMEVDTTVGKPGRQTVHKREVRLILIEYLQGKCMENLNPKRLTKKVRSGILKKVFEAEAELYHAGVSHNDVAPRNIIFIGSDWANLGFQVKFIDFNVAQIVRLDKYQRTRQKQQQLLSKYPGRMLSPIARFWDMVGDFCDAGWLPDDGLRANEWLWKHFHKDEKFIPVVRNEKVPEKCPKHLGWDDLVISGCDSGCGSGSGS